MNFFEIVKENLQNFLRANTKITAGITILLVVLAVFAFASGIFQENKILLGAKTNSTDGFLFLQRKMLKLLENQMKKLQMKF